MFPNTENQANPYFDAIHGLLEYQFATQKTIWLMFITTLFKPSVINNELMQKLCMPTRDNCNKYPAFTEKMATIVPVLSLQHDTFNVNLEGLSDDQIIRLFGIALGKWLLSLGQSPSPKWTVKMRPSFQYTINKEKGAVMHSLAFEMRPNFAPPTDASGMSGLEFPPPVFPTEAESAIRLVDYVAKMVDVDVKLAGDAALRGKLLDEAADLMASAGYGREKYVKWVNDGENIPHI